MGLRVLLTFILIAFIAAAASAQCAGNSGFTITSTKCTGQNIVFTDTGSATPDSIKWHFKNDNSNYTGSSLVKIYSTGQTDTVWMYRFFNTPSACVDTVFQVFTVTHVTATISPTGTVHKCIGDTQTLTANTGSGLGYQWYKDGAAIGGATVNTYNATVSGTYRVEITLNGCTKLSDTVVINVHNYPTANFTFAPDSACSGSTVAFTNTSSGGNLSYQWSFGNGTTTTNQNPTVVYDTTGTRRVVSYQVRLITSTLGNCRDTVTKTVYVKRKPDPSIDDFNNIPKFTQCNVSSFAFSLQIDNVSTTKTTNASYTINWGDGNTQNFGPTFDTITHVYATTGAYTITVTATDSSGCSASKTYSVFNGGNPAVSIGNTGSTSGCTPYGLTFSVDTSKATGVGNNAAGTIYTLTFNDGSAPSVYTHPPPSTISKTFTIPSCGVATTGFPNSFQAEMSVTNPCGTNSATVKPIYISTKPEADIDFFPNGDTACRDDIITIIDNSDTGSVSSNSGCNETPRRLWDIFPATGWTLLSGGFGNHSNWNNNPANWGTGSLQVQFTDTGVFTVQLIVGNIAQAGISVCGSDTITRQLRIFRYPVADFTLNENPITGCVPAVLTTTNSSTGDQLSYNWSVSPNSGYTVTSGTLTSATPTFQFNTAGTYYVTLIASNRCTSDTLVDTVTVRDVPVASLPGPRAYCGPDTISFDTLLANILHRPTYNSNFGDTLSYEWTVTGGGYTYTSGDSTQPYPSIYLSTPGTYTVQVRFSNECGDDTATQVITIHPLPDAAFNVNDTDQCINGNNFVFTDATTISSGSIATWAWTFGDGGSSSAQNPAKTYATTDTFDVRLIVTSNQGCLDTVTRQMIVFPKPTPAFSINDTDQCLNGNSFIFTNGSTISSGSNTYLWRFTNRPADISTAASPTFVYDTVGTFAVKLVVTSDNGCSDSVTHNVYIRPKPVPAFTVNDTTQCVNGNNFAFTNGTTILSGTLTYVWTFGDGSASSAQNPSNVYGTADTFAVKLVATSNFGCKDSITHPVYVFPKPTVDFTINDTDQCFVGNSFVFTNGSSIGSGTVSYKWQFSSNGADTSVITNPTKNYTSSGTFPVKLIGTSDQGCKDSATHTVTVYPEPDAAFNINDTDQCLNGNNFVFTDTSVVSGLHTRVWTFGDGGSSTSANPSHSYATEGTYQVKLVITTITGACLDSITRPVYVYPKPLPAFTVNDSQQCFPGNAFIFTNGTTISAGSTTYRWKFSVPSDTDTSNATSPTKNYATAGVYIVRLIATSDKDCKDSVQNQVVADPQITNNTIGPDQGVCLGFAPDSILHSTAILTGGDTTFSYQWQESTDSVSWSNIGGATSASYQPPALTATRWYRRVVASGPCADTSLPAKITVAPDISNNGITASQIICAGFAPANFNGGTPTGGLGTFTYQWQESLDSSNWSNIAGAQDTGYQAGVLTNTTFYRRIVTSGVCVKQGNVLKVLVNPKPSVSFTTASVCFGFNATFTSGSTISTGSITQYNWNFGDGNTATGSSQSHSYATAGTYTIKLTAISDSSCSDSTTRTIRVHPKPVAAYTANDTCFGFDNNFNATSSTVSAGAITLYQWDFGDATTGLGSTLSKTYGAAGSYNAKLVVTTDSSCRDSVTHTIVVHPRPVPAFTVNDTDQCVNGNNFVFTNASSIASGSSTYQWNFGEAANDTSTQTSPSKTYFANGNYDVQLKATSNFGCFDSIIKTVYVYAKPTPTFAVNDTDQCLNGNSFVFTNNSTINPIVGLGWVWTFGDGGNSTLKNPVHSYSAEGTYPVKLVVTSVNNCKDSVDATVYVYPKPIPAFTINDTLQCFSGNTFIYTNGSTIASGTQTYFWKLNLLDAADTSTLTDVTRNYATSGNMTVRLTATSDKNCKDSIQKDIYVKPDIINNTIGPAQNICSGSSADSLKQTGTTINGGNGTFIFQWQESTDSISWSDISGATSANLQPTAQFVPKWYRRVAVSGPCSDTSVSVRVSVTPSIGNNTISSNQSQCAGFVPSGFTGTIPSGGSGIYTYQWQISTDSASWTDISGATDSVYQSGVLNVTSWFRRKVTSGTCTVISNPVKVNVNPKPAASFTSPSVCFGFNAQFTSTSTIATGSITQYNWTFGDGNSATGTTNPQNGYTAVGSYTAKLIITSDSGCMDSTTRTLWVHPKPAASFVNNDTCFTFAHSFNATASTVSAGSITNYSWNFGDATTGSGSTIAKTYPAAGSYTAKLIVTTDSACKDSITNNIVVYPKPVASYDVPDSTQCVNGNNFPFNNLSTITSGSLTYLWDLGENANDTSTLTNPTKVYAAFGNYDVKLVATSNFGCRDSVTATMIVFAKPAQAYSINDTDQCLNGNSFVFTNGSTINPVVGLSYAWTFGDGGTSTAANPTKTYASEGTYPVKLVVTSVNNCKDSVTKTVYVYPKPDPDFATPDTLQCFGPNSFTFTNSSSISGGTLSYFWRFDLLTANDTSTQTSPTKTYADSGTYTIRLTATSDKNCKDSIERQVIVKPDIINNVISASQSVCSGGTADTLRQSGATVSGGNGAFTYIWQESGDSSTWFQLAGISTPGYAPGVMTVTTWYRRIVTSGPCADTSVPIKINVTPGIGNNTIASNQSICEGFAPALFTGTQPTGGSGLFTYQWQISPDSASWSNIGSATDSSYQSGVLTLTRYFRRAVTSGSCTVFSTPIKVTVFPKPAASFTTASVCFGFSASYSSTSSVSSGSIVQSNWNFGDGNTDSGTTVSHSYAAAGSYTPRLIVTTAVGCKDSTTRTLHVHPKPAAAFVNNDTCLTFANNFNAATSTVATGSITGYSWTLGDGATATGITTSRTYAAVGSYLVKLIVTTDSLCQDSTTKTVIVHPNPVAGYTVNDSDQCVNGNNFAFTNTSTISAGSNTYSWNFGQSSTDTSAQTNPSKVYSANGNFTVKLIAISNFGCTDSSTKTMIVYAKPAQAFNINDTDQCVNGNNFVFTNASTINPAVGLSYFWTFGNGDTSTQTNPTKVYAASGTYPVKLRVTSINSCTDSITKNVYVYPKPTPGFSINDTLQCFGPNSFVYSNTSTVSSGTLTHFWRFDLLTASDTSSQTSPAKHYSGAGTYTVRLINTSDKGCKDSIEKQVTVKPNIVNNAISAPQFICQGSTPDTLRQTSGTVSGGDGTFTYLWQRSTDSISWTTIGGATSTLYGPPALTVTTWYRRLVNSGPCVDTSTPVKVNVTPSITNNIVSSSQNVCYAQAPSLLTSTSPGGGSGTFAYLWQQSNDSITWSTATGTNTSISYQPGALTDSIYYRRRIVSGACGTISNTLKMAVKPLPVVKWGATTVCFNNPTVFTDSSTVSAGNTNTGWSWVFADGTTSSLQNPSKVYTAGTYNTKLIVTTNFGCKDSLSKSATVYPKPQAGYSAPNTCNGFATAFTDTAKVSSGSIVSWAWDFADSFSSTTRHPSHTYFTYGTYNVRQIVTSDKGCKDTLIKSLIIHPLPQPDFVTDSACYPDSTHYFDATTIPIGTITAWQWRFGNGDTSILQNPASKYPASGIYVAKLIATSNQGCKDSISKGLVVYPLPSISFTGDTVECVNRTLVYNSTSSGAATYVWNFGDGHTATGSVASNTFTATGFYRLVLVGRSAHGCEDSAAMVVHIIDAPNAAFTTSPDTGCGPLPVTFTNLSTGQHTTYDWNFGNSTSSTQFNPSTVTYAQGNVVDSIYHIILAATNICGSDTATDSVTVFPKPVPDIVTDIPTGCSPQMFSLYNRTKGLPISYFWDFGDGDTSTSPNPPAHMYSTNAGQKTYTIKLRSGNHCGYDSTSYTITVFPKPDAGFSFANNCVGFTSSFTDTAKVASGSIASWGWTFGDGNSATIKNPSTTYASYGTYNVTQIVTTDKGCLDTALVPITIHPKPTANFGAAFECYPDSSRFIDSSTVALGSVTNWSWTFGNGNTSTQQNPKNKYASAGTYVAKLIVTSNQGCKDSVTKAVVVNPKPVMAFSGDTLECVNNTVFYNNTSSGAATYNWNYGDGHTSTGTTGSNTYTAPGFYRVVLTGTTAFGCVDSTAMVVHIIQGPTAAFTSSQDTGCAQLSVAFTNNSTGHATNYNWNFGNGTSSTLFSPPAASYGQSLVGDSAYIITLTATNICGTSVAKDTVTVFPKPVAAFSLNTTAGCSPQTFTITNITTAFPQTFLWDFGNGDTSTLQNPPPHLYSISGGITTFNIKLTARNHCGFDTVSRNVMVYPKPVAGFSFNNNCFGFASTFTDTAKVVSGSIITRAWDFGDTNTSFAQNPSNTYAAYGTYNVRQIVTTDRGCSDTLTKAITIHPQPVANFGAGTACFKDSTAFTDSSTVALGSITNWSWSFGDTKTSTTQHPKNRYSSAGTYITKLLVTSDQGCKDSVNKSVIVRPLPSVAFSGDTLECAGKTVFYSNGSTGVSSYSWNYDDGHTSTGATGSNTFASPGFYRVKLIGTTAFGCKDSATMVVHIIGVPVAAFVSSQDTGCAPLQVNFTNNSSGHNVTYNWNFGNGTNSTQHTPSTVTYIQSQTTDTSYLVILAATNICGTRTAKDTITVYPKPVAVFTTNITAGCSPQAFTITNATTAFPQTFLWDFGNGDTSTAQNPPPLLYSITAGATTFNIKLTARNHCGFDTVSHNVTVYPKPVAGFSFANNCFGFASSFTDTSGVASGSIITRAWDFGDTNSSFAQNPSNTYAAYGTYNVTQIVTTDRGCKDTITRPITIHPKPVANFGSSTACFRDSTVFTDSSTVALGSLTNWQWSFGDANSSTLQSPKNRYSSAGTYITKLIVTSDQGCKDSINKSVIVRPLPAIAFSGDTLECVGNTLFYSNSSSGASGYAWDYGDGHTSTGTTGSNTFASPGFYRVVLTGTTAFGCKDSAAMVVHIIGVPVAAFTPSQDTGCAQLQVNFTNNSTGHNVTYNWNFGNGTNSTQHTPTTVSYIQSQTNDSSYIITLAATNICGTSTARDTITVFPKPVAIFTTNITAGCSPQLFSIANNTTAFPQTFLWDFGNGDTSTAQNPPPHLYTINTGATTFNIKLTARNHCGFDTVSHNVTVYPKPVAGFSLNNNCFGFASSFTDTAKVASGSVTGWNWAFGDANSATSQSPSNTYAAYGTYNVTQIVTTDRGCKDTLTKPITIHPKPVANFGVSVACFRDSSAFTDSSTVALGSITNWNWAFGDANTSTLQHPKNRYSAAGTYITKLIVTSDQGCKDSINKSVIVRPLPAIAFTGDTLECVGKTLFYSNSSSGAASYAWNYGDGNTSAGTTGSNTFSAPGFYRVVLTGTTAFGCKDSAAMVVHIIGVPNAAFVPSQDTGCAPLQVNFTNASTGHNVTYNWDFGNGTNSTQHTPSAVSYIQSKTADSAYIVTLKATNICGTSTAKDTITVFPKPVAIFSTNITAGCSPQAFAITNGTTAFPQTFLWDFGNGDTSTSQNPPPHLYTINTGITTFNIKLTARNHCGFDTVSHNVTVYPKPVAGFSLANNCFGFATPFTDTAKVASGSLVSWSWTFGDGNTSFAQSPSNTYAAHGTYNVRQVVTSDRNCKDTLTKAITIHPKPVANFGVTTTCLRDSSAFTDSSTVALGSITNWVWAFGDANSSTLQHPKNKYSSAGTYITKLIVTSNQGCKDSVNKSVTVHPLPTIAFSGDTLECVGKTLFYSNTSTGASGYNWNYGDGNTSTGTTGSNTYSAPGFYRVVLTGTTAFGCKDSAAMVVHIIGVPNAAFVPTQDTGCAPLQVNFTNNSSGHNVTYNWNFGNGTNSTQHTPPAVSYVQSKTTDSLYIVTLKATNICGTSTVKDTITVFPKPVAIFSTNITAGCSPQAFAITNGTTAFPQTFLWDFGNGDTSTLQNPPPHLYTITGGITTFTIKLTARNHCGFDTVSHSVTVYPKPKAGFSFANNCFGFATPFTDTAKVASGSITNWNWTYGDGNNSTAKSPIYTYLAYGTYNVTQIVTTDRGCKDTFTRAMVVHPKPRAAFGIPVACLRDSSIFTDSSTVALGAITNWQWDFGDAGTSSLSNPKHLYAASGNFTSKLIITTDKGCKDSTTRPVTVRPVPKAIFKGDTLECNNRDVFYTNSSTGAVTYHWDFGDGDTSNASVGKHKFNNSGYYRVVLVAKTVYGCSDSSAMVVRIIAPPNPAFAMLPDTGCAPLNVTFVNNSTGTYTAYDWDLGDGTTSTLFTPPSVIYPQSLFADTAYYITLKASNLCATNVAKDTVIVFPKPLANFGPDKTSGCTPITVNFTNTSTAFPQNYLWDFGDGNTSTAQNPPAHVFTADSVIRTYTIRLRVSNKCGFDTVSRKVTVLPKNAKSLFGVDTLIGCVPLTVNITDFSLGATLVNYDLGDGNTSNVRNFKHTFTTPGSFKIRQFIANTCSQDTSEKTIVVQPGPVVALTIVPSTRCAGHDVQFQDKSVGVSGLLWQFGTGDTSTLNNPAYKYKNSGKYIVKLTGTSATTGCKSSVLDSVSINTLPKPVMQVDSSQGCPGHTATFTNTSTGTSFVTWNFGDGNTSAGISPIPHTYTKTGLYTARMIVRDANGCEDSTDKPIQIHPIPVAAFTTTSTFCGTPVNVNFNNNSTGAVSYQWDLGNTQTSTNNNPTGTYTDYITYTARLTAFNQFGCKDTTSASFEIYHKPVPTFTLDTNKGCPPVKVTFTSNVQFANTYLWDFGDGGTSTQQSPTHTYSVSGKYNVKLKVISSGTCADSLTLTPAVDVYPDAVAGFDFNISSSGLDYGLVTFIDQSQNASQYLWQFGDGNNSIQPAPQHRYGASGNYVVRQYITTDKGCKDTIEKPLEMPFFGGLFVPNAFTPGAGGPDVSIFKPVAVSLRKYRVTVYDTWGKLLWESTALQDTKPAEGWDGTYDGKPCHQDVYVWKIEAEFLDGSPWKGQKAANGRYYTEGTVTLIR